MEAVVTNGFVIAPRQRIASVGTQEQNRGSQWTETLAGLHEEYYPKLARYIFVRIGNRAEAEDLAGEVFLKALRSIGSFKDLGVPMQAWLFRIAHNIVVDHLRKHGKRKNVPLEEAANVPHNSNPEETALTNIQFAEVKQLMERITPAQREVLTLRFGSGLTSGEVARIMGRSDGAVRELQHEALQALRKLLGIKTKENTQQK